MCCIGPAVYFRQDILALRSNAATEQDRTMSVDRIVKLVAVGGAVGIFCGLFGVGGGAVTVPAISFCLPELTHHEVPLPRLGCCTMARTAPYSHCALGREAIGTSLVAMVPPAVSGLIQHSRTGALIVAAALPLAVGTASGSFLTGKYVALEVDEDTLRRLFSGTMVVLGLLQLKGARALRAAARQAAKL